MKMLKSLGLKERFTIIITTVIAFIIICLIGVVLFVKVKDTNQLTDYYINSHFEDINHFITYDQSDAKHNALQNWINNHSYNFINSNLEKFYSELVHAYEIDEEFFETDDYRFFDISQAAQNMQIELKNEIEPLIKPTIKQKDRISQNLKNYVQEKVFYDNGFVYILEQNGTPLFYPENKNRENLHIRLFQEMAESNRGRIRTYDNIAGTNANLYYKYFDDINAYIIIKLYEREYIRPFIISTLINSSVSLILALVLFSIILHFLMKTITNPLSEMEIKLEQLSLGKTIETFTVKTKDEIGKIARSLNLLIDGLKKTTNFAQAIDEGNYDFEFTPLSHEDDLGNSLIKMRNNLKEAKKQEEIRKAEDKKRQWATEGLAKFSDILRLNNDKLDILSFDIISNMVKYLDVNQGGLFILNEDDEKDKYLELLACYAYDRQKFLTKKVQIGEGLTGTCFLEKKTIFLKEIPEDYINITSGLGEASPNTLLIVPLKLNEDVFGVIELASFREFEKHEIEFVEKIAESIASTISSVKINMRTAYLLEQSQQQAEEMRAQEEEMRQNNEELQATQEEMERKNREMERKNQELQAAQKDMELKAEETKAKEKERLKQMQQHKNEVDDLKSEIELLYMQLKRKDKQIEKLKNENNK